MTRISTLASSFERIAFGRNGESADNPPWTRDLVEGPLLLDSLLVIGWSLARLIETSGGLAAIVVIGGIIALRWPATGAVLASLAFMFPARSNDLESGALLLMSAGIGCLVAAARSGIRPSVPVTVVFAAALVATTGIALLRLLGGPLSVVATEATLRWAGLGLGLASLPIHVFLIGRGARHAIATLAGVTALAVGIGCISGLWPGALDSTMLGSLLSTVPSDRATGPFPSPNRLGTVAAIVAVGAAVLAWERRGWLQVALGVCATVATLAVVVSFSRGALLGLSVAVVVLISRRSLRSGAVVALVCAVAILVITPAFMNARLETAGAPPGLSAEQAANDAGRVEAWKAGVQMGIAQPVTGHGYGSFAVLGPRYGGPANLRTAHNETIALFAEVGLPGVLSFVGLIGACLWALRRRSVASDLGLAAVLVFVTASSFNIQSVYPQVTTLVWAMVAWGLALGTDVPAADGDGRDEHGEGREGDAYGRALTSR